jgi:hypothetical protein
MRKIRSVAVSLFVLSSVFCFAGCASHADGQGGSNDKDTGNKVRLGADGMPVGPDGKPLPTKLDGSYELTTGFDLTSTGLLPKVTGETLKALSGLKDHPSQTIVDLMDAAHVPLITNILDVVPSELKGYVLGYIDDHVFSALFQAVPVTQKIAGLLEDMASLVTNFQVVTTLDLPPGNDVGDCTAKHGISGMAYDWDGQHHVVRAPSLLDQATTQSVQANAVALADRSPELESGRLKLGDHTFSIPIGEWAVYGADELAKARYGATDLRDALGKLVDCDGLAAAVANECLAGEICVGHQDDLKSICTTGLDLVVQAVQAALKSFDVPVLHLQDGVAQMWDAPTAGGPLDAVVDRIDHGFWTAAVDVGSQSHPVVATFSGQRVGDDPGASAAKTEPK